MKSDKLIRVIKKDGFVKVPFFLKKNEVKKAIILVNHYYSQLKKIKLKGVPKRDSSDKILYNLQNKNIFFINLIKKSLIMKIGGYFLNDPYYKFLDSAKPNFNLLYYNARSGGKKLDLHIDSYIPFKGDRTFMMQFVILLEDSTLDNGCTTAVKGSHKSGDYSDRDSKNIIPITGKAGDLIIWDSRLWHGTLENYSGKSRWALVATFGSWWIKPKMNFCKSMPNNIYKRCNNLQKQLLGFCSMPPLDENQRINTKCGYDFLKKNVFNYKD